MLDRFNSIVEIINSEHGGGSTSLLDEMGLGYIYDILPQNESIDEEDINIIVESLNECANEYDMVSVLNESIKDNIKNFMDKKKTDHAKEKKLKEKKKNEKYKIFDETRDTRVDIDRRRQNDDYDLKRDKKRNKYDDRRDLTKRIIDDTYEDHRNRKEDKRSSKNQAEQDKYLIQKEREQDKYEDKHDLKKQKEQDKYDFKRQKKLDRYERKKDIIRYNDQKKRATLCKNASNMLMIFVIKLVNWKKK